MAVTLCKKQTPSICMYINVIYLFVMHGIYVHTVLSLWRKNTFPSFHASQRIEFFLCHYWWWLASCSSIYLPKAYVVLQHILSWSDKYFRSSNFPSFPRLSADAKWCMMRCYAIWYDGMMQNDVYAEGKNPLEYTPRLCIPLGMTLESLHLLLRWYFSSASP
jgi:hypothetical protein